MSAISLQKINTSGGPLSGKVVEVEWTGGAFFSPGDPRQAFAPDGLNAYMGILVRNHATGVIECVAEVPQGRRITATVSPFVDVVGGELGRVGETSSLLFPGSIVQSLGSTAHTSFSGDVGPFICATFTIAGSGQWAERGIVGTGLTPGVKDIQALDSNGLSNILVSAYTVTKTFPAPTITSVTPSAGRFGDLITVNGSGFGSAGDGGGAQPDTVLTAFVKGVSNTVRIAVDNLIRVSNSQYTFTVPNMAGLDLKDVIAVVTASGFGGGTATASKVLRYKGSTTATSVTPNRTLELTTASVTITGSGFTSASQVSVDDIACTNVVWVSVNTLTCTVPALSGRNAVLVVNDPTNGPSDDLAFHYFRTLAFLGVAIVLQSSPTVAPDPDSAHTIAVASVRVNTKTANFAAPPTRNPNFYDAAQQRIGLNRSHYLQAFQAADIFLKTLQVQHREDGSSLISLAGMLGLRRVTSPIAVSLPVGSERTVNLGLHGGQFWTGITQVHSPVQVDGEGNELAHPRGNTAFCSTRLAFDDTSIYGVVEYERSVAGGLSTFRATHDAFLFVPTDTPLPPLTQPTFGNAAVVQKSMDLAVFTRILGNSVALAAIIGAGHTLRTGEHRVPLTTFAGYAVALDADVNAPALVGDDPTIYEIGPVDPTLLYLQPGMIGLASGCGQVSATLGFSATLAYLILRRVTAGTSNAFHCKVPVVTNS